MSAFQIALGMSALAGVFGTLVAFRLLRLKAELARWASENEYALLSRKFYWSDDDAYGYRVVVRDRLGRDRRGSFRYPRWWSPYIDVRWRD